MGRIETIYIDKWIEELLNEYCKEHNCSPSRAIKVILHEYLESRKKSEVKKEVKPVL
ncbi:MAG: hypothetical protein QXK51_11515 [Candidatus Methanomethylicia archaeon]